MDLFKLSSAVPEAVQRAFAAGSFERIGGLVRDLPTGRIVAFLRESTDLTKSAAELTTLFEGGTGLGVLNLSVATMGFAIVLNRVSAIQQRLQQAHDLLEKLNQKIDL